MRQLASDLFRREALSYRGGRLHGEVSLTTPMSWQLIGYSLLGVLIIGIVYLSLGSYARIETVPGVVSIDPGLATIASSRSGVVHSVLVAEGQQVQKGARLATVRTEEDLSAGETAPTRVRDALIAQKDQLGAQAAATARAAEADKARLRERMEGISNELNNIEEQIREQRQLLRMSAADFYNAQDIARRGFISQRDLDAREATLRSRRQQLSQLLQTEAVRRADLKAEQHAIRQTTASASAQIKTIHASQTALQQQVARAESEQGYLMTAPVSGIVTAIAARAGQQVVPGQELMVIIPVNAHVVVDLYVPTTSIGFIEPDQSVNLAIDAFPYQEFGTIPGRIVTVSRAPIKRQDASGTMASYLVRVSLGDTQVSTFRHPKPLLAGMTLSAQIMTEKRSLLEWLFEPLFAVKNS